MLDEDLRSNLCWKNRPEEVVVSPQDSVTMMNLDWTGDYSTVHTCSTQHETTFERKQHAIISASITSKLKKQDLVSPSLSVELAN